MSEQTQPEMSPNADIPEVSANADIASAQPGENTSGIESQTGEYVPEFRREEDAPIEEAGVDSDAINSRTDAMRFYDDLEDVVGKVRTQSRLLRQRHMVTAADQLEDAAKKLAALAREFQEKTVPIVFVAPPDEGGSDVAV